MSQVLQDFKPAFDTTRFRNLMVDMQEHIVIISPETAADTKFGLFIVHPQEQEEVTHAMGLAQPLLNLLAVAQEGETNLFKRAMLAADAAGTPLLISTDDATMDRSGNLMITSETKPPSLLNVTGFATDNEEVAVVFFYPEARTMAYVDFQKETITRITLVPEELLQQQGASHGYQS